MLKYLALMGILSISMSVVAQDDETEEEKKVKAKEIVYDQPTEWSVYPAKEPVSTFVINGDELWYATPSSVFCASIKKRLVQTYSALGSIPATEVTCMATDGKSVWIGGKNGVAVRGAKDFTAYTAEKGLPDNAVNAMAGSGGKVWVGTENGLAMFNGSEWKVFTTKNGLSHNKVTAIVIDDKGKVWVGTAKGISVFDGSSWSIQDMKKGMSWNNVKALGWDPRKQTLWAAVGERDINAFTNGSWNTFMDIQSDVTSLMIDTQSRLWVGSSSAGLIKYNGDEWINDPKKISIPAAQIQWMARDGAGNLFYAAENGIIRLANPYPY